MAAVYEIMARIEESGGAWVSRVTLRGYKLS